MNFYRILSSLVVIILVVWPIASLGWGSIDDVRYKVKGADGNRWASLMSNGIIVRGSERPNTITFTFDDGPDHRTTPILLDQLDRYGIKAAFFVNGWKFHKRTAGGLENQAVLREIYRRGHFLGNHTFSHKDITTLNEDQWRSEVFQVRQMVEWVIGRRPWFFRPPFGKVDTDGLNTLAKSGYTVVMWNMDTLDWKANSAREVFENAKRSILSNSDGGVMLMHDTNRHSVEAFPLIIEWIQERNARLRAEGRDTLEIVGLEHYIQKR